MRHEDFKPFHRSFEEIAEKNADVIAICQPQGHSELLTKITYKVLNQKSNRLADYLRQKNYPANSMVGLFFEPSINYIISLLAVFKAGYTALPLDPNTDNGIDRLHYFVEYTKDHLNLILFDSNVKDHELLQQSLNQSLQNLDDLDLQQYMPNNLSYMANPDDIACCMFTSGSSGKPKGVLVPYRGYPNCMNYLAGLLDVRVGDVYAQLAAIGFDASIQEILVLGSGATLLIVPYEDRVAHRLSKAFRQDKDSYAVTMATITPSIWHQLDPEDFPGLNTIITTGEKPDSEQIKKWLQNKKIINGYGLTETTISYSCSVFTSSDTSRIAESDKVTIGNPGLGFEASVVRIKKHQDISYIPIEHLKPGESGELVAVGAGVVHGYYKQPELTKKRFISFPDPRNNNNTLRGFRTRDEVSRNQAGELCIEKRLDRGMKIYGKLTYPQETETILRELLAQDFQIDLSERNIFVNIDLNRYGHPKICAYIEHQAAVPLDYGYLYDAMADMKLPRTMIPTRYVICNNFPATERNKRDDKAIIQSNQKKLKYILGDDKRELNKLEAEMAELWKKILDLDSSIKLRPDSRFDQLGGTSILLPQLIVAIKQKYRRAENPVNIDLTDLAGEFNEFFTLARFARYIHHKIDDSARLVFEKSLMRPGFDEAYLKPDSEVPVYMIHTLFGNPQLDYNPLINKLQNITRREMYLIQARGLEQPSDMGHSITEIASVYAEIIRAQHKEKGLWKSQPIIVLGWSMGGILGLEVVNILESYDHPAVLHAIDTWCPRSRQQQRFSLYKKLLRKLMRDSLPAIGINVDIDWDNIQAHSDDTTVRSKATLIRKVFSQLQQHNPDNANLIWTIKTLLLAELKYHKIPKIENMILFAAEESQATYKSDLGWSDAELPRDHIRSYKNTNHFNLRDDQQFVQDVDYYLRLYAMGLRVLCTTHTFESRSDFNLAQLAKDESLVFDRGLIPQLHEVALKARLSSIERSLPPIVYIHGMHGTGKSHLVKIYAQIYKRYYKKIILFHAKTESELLAEYRELAIDKGLQEGKINYNTPSNIIIEAIKKYLNESANEVMIIFDDLRELNLLKKYIPSKPALVLVTTNVNCAKLEHAFEVNLLTQQQSINWLKQAIYQDRVTSQYEVNILSSLSSILGCLPLAITQIAAYINETGITAAKVLTNFEQRKTRLEDVLGYNFYDTDQFFDPMRSESDQHVPVLLTWQATSLQLVDRPTSLAILYLASFLSSDDIPCELLREIIEKVFTSQFSDGYSKNDLVQDIKLLNRYHLLTGYDQKENLISIHSLFSQIVRLSGQNQKQAGIIFPGGFPLVQLVQTLLTVLLDHFDYDPLLPLDKTRACISLQTQVEAMLHNTPGELHASISYIKLLRNYALILIFFYHDSDQAVTMLERAEILVNYIDVDDIYKFLRFDIQVQLARAYNFSERNEEGLELIERIKPSSSQLIAVFKAGIQHESKVKNQLEYLLNPIIIMSVYVDALAGILPEDRVQFIECAMFAEEVNKLLLQLISESPILARRGLHYIYHVLEVVAREFEQYDKSAQKFSAFNDNLRCFLSDAHHREFSVIYCIHAYSF